LAGLAALAGPARVDAVELVTGNNYFPYSDERVPGGGLATVIVKAVFADMGMDPNVTFLPWADGYAAARDGRYLATFPYIRTAEREVDFFYSEPLFTVRPQVFMNFQTAPGITQISDLAGKTLCVPEGWGVDGYLSEIVDSGQLRVFDRTSIVGCFKLLHDGKVDAISMDRRLGTVAARTIDGQPWTKTRRLTNDSNPNHLIISKGLQGGAEWMRRFNASLEKLRSSGALAELTQRYFEAYEQ
jgi:polar amino acid transport system substrate-binding protein